MTPLSAQIFQLLEHEQEYIPVDVLGKALQKTDRQLRGQNGESGILDTASREIFEEHGLLLVTSMRRPSGVRLTKDPEEIEKALGQWKKWFWPIKEHKIDHYERALRTIRSGQCELALQEKIHANDQHRV